MNLVVAFLLLISIGFAAEDQLVDHPLNVDQRTPFYGKIPATSAAPLVFFKKLYDRNYLLDNGESKGRPCEFKVFQEDSGGIAFELFIDGKPTNPPARIVSPTSGSMITALREESTKRPIKKNILKQKIGLKGSQLSALKPERELTLTIFSDKDDFVTSIEFKEIQKFKTLLPQKDTQFKHQCVFPTQAAKRQFRERVKSGTP